MSTGAACAGGRGQRAMRERRGHEARPTSGGQQTQLPSCDVADDGTLSEPFAAVTRRVMPRHPNPATPGGSTRVDEVAVNGL